MSKKSSSKHKKEYKGIGGSFKNFGASVPRENKIFISHSLDLVEEIQHLLEKTSQKPVDLAKSLKKSESEISKWLSGYHNMTLKTISKIEDTLNGTILTTPTKERVKYTKTIEELRDKLLKLQKNITALKEENNELKSQITTKLTDKAIKVAFSNNVKEVNDIIIGDYSPNYNSAYHD